MFDCLSCLSALAYFCCFCVLAYLSVLACLSHLAYHQDVDHVGFHFAAAVGAVEISCCLQKFLAAAGLKTFDHQDADHVRFHFLAAVGAVRGLVLFPEISGSCGTEDI